MKRYVKLFESYVKEYAEYQQPDYPGEVQDYEGAEDRGAAMHSNEDPVEIALEIAQEYGIDPSEVEATMAELEGEGEEELGINPSLMDVALMVTPLVSLVLAGMLGSNIEAKMKSKRWVKGEIEDRLEKIMNENPELAEEDKHALMKVVADEVMNDPEIQEKLERWNREGNAPTHRRHSGPKYSYREHVFGSGR